MPVVNGKHYPYTQAGKKAAKKAMKKKHVPMNIENYHKSRGKMKVLKGTKLSVAMGHKQY